MKNGKKFILVVIVLALVLPLLGCDNVSADPTSTGQHGTSQNTIPASSAPTQTTKPYPPIALEVDPIPDDEVTVSIQYLPEHVENPEDLPVLKWVCASYFTRQWSEEAVCELNQMLADKDMPFRLQFVMVNMDKHDWYASTYWCSLPEVQDVLVNADLIFGQMGPDERLEYLMPITEYVAGDAQPSLKDLVAHELNWLTASVDGDIYGIPQYDIQPCCNGWRVNIDFMEKYGLRVEDFSKNFWEMDALFAQIYEQNGNKPFLYIDPLNDTCRLTPGCSNVLFAQPSVIGNEIKYAFQGIGAIFGIDYGADVPTVVNTMETEVYRNVWEAVLRYRASGYVLEDTADITAFEQAQIYYAGVIGDTVFYENNSVHIPVTTVTFQNCYSGHYMSGIAADSQHKAEAVALLNLIAEDETFRTHLFFGKEGRDYKVTNGIMRTIRQEDGSKYDMSYISMLSKYGNLCDEMKTGYPTHEGKTKLQTYRDNMDSVEFCYYPVVFDFTGFEQELETLGELLGKYLREYSKMTEEDYDQMLQELKDAGSEKIQAELQRQLDEWLAANPDWQ